MKRRISAAFLLKEVLRLNKKGTVVHHYIRETQETAQHKDRRPAILKNETFQNILKELETAEETRIFCGHGMTHLLDTARIMEIINLEEDLLIPKDLVYAAGLLHDIGRLCEYRDGTGHEEAAIPIAKKILEELGHPEEEQNMILLAISSHRGSTSNNFEQAGKLASLLYRADKLGRLCFKCESREECNWPEDRKNTDAFA